MPSAIYGNLNNMNQNELNSKAWYKQFWPWFLITLPGIAVVASIITIIIASTNSDGVVVDNYYKEGLAINQKLDQVDNARAMNLQAFASVNKSVLVVTFAEQSKAFNDTLLLMKFIHPTRAELDFEVILSKTEHKQFQAELDKNIQGTWRIHLSPVIGVGLKDKTTDWRLAGKWSNNKIKDIALTAK